MKISCKSSSEVSYRVEQTGRGGAKYHAEVAATAVAAWAGTHTRRKPAKTVVEKERPRSSLLVPTIPWRAGRLLGP